MKITKAGYEIFPQTKGEETLKKIERIARVCYKSEDKITEDSYTRMIRSLVNSKHYAMLEHGTIIMELAFSVYHELSGCVRLIEEVNGEKSYLRFTSKHYSGRYIVSGNMRAWLEFLEYCDKYGYLVPKLVLDILFDPQYTPVFDTAKGLDIMYKSYNAFTYGVAKELYYDDLTDKEKLVHGDLSVKFTVDRGVSHEIVRHRQASFAQESTRYCNYGNKDGGVTFIEPFYLISDNTKYSAWKTSAEVSEREYLKLLSVGSTPQEARAVLDTSLKTELVMTANLKEWIHFFNLRALGTTGKPHPQMLEVALPLLSDMVDLEPMIFGGLTSE